MEIWHLALASGSVMLSIAGLALAILKLAGSLSEWKGSTESGLKEVNKTLTRIEQELERVWDNHGRLLDKVSVQAAELAAIKAVHGRER